MQAVIHNRYGSADMLKIAEVARPEIADDQILVRIRASAVTTADWRLRASAFPPFAWLAGRLMFGFFRPKRKIPGSDFAGQVVAAGPAVTRFRPGDAVFGFAGHGAHAEYLAVAETGAVAAMPATLSYDQAAAVPFGALSALVFLRDFAKLRAGQNVLVIGASGGVGVFAVQLAKHFGATVTGVSSAGNLALVRSLGADHVVDYSATDIAAPGKSYDLIFDTAGKSSYRRSRPALAPDGVYLPLEFGFREIVQALVTAVGRGRKVVIGVSGDTRADLEYLGGLLARRTIRPVIDGRYPLHHIAAAHRRVESRHKRGSVVVTLPEEGISVQAIA